MGVRRGAAGALRTRNRRGGPARAAAGAAGQAPPADRRAAGDEDAARRARHRLDPHGGLPDRQARVREPAGDPRDRARVRAGRPGGKAAGRAARLWPLAGRKGSPRLPGDRRAPGAARLRRPVLGSCRPGRAQPVLGRGARPQPLQPGVRRARRTRQSRDDRRYQPGAVHGVGRHPGHRLPALARRRGRSAYRHHRYERRGLPVALDRRARPARRRDPAVVLPDRAADADGQPDLRGSRQRPRAGPARPRLGRHRPRGPAAARVSPAAARLGGGARLLSDRGHAPGDARGRRRLPSPRTRRQGRAQRGLPQAPVFAREPGAGVRVPRSRLREAAGHEPRGRKGAARGGGALHAERPGARGPARTLAASR